MESEMGVFIEKTHRFLNPGCGGEISPSEFKGLRSPPRMESEAVVFMEKNALIFKPRLWEGNFTLRVQSVRNKW